MGSRIRQFIGTMFTRREREHQSRLQSATAREMSSSDGPEIAHVLFMDIVKYSLLSMDQQTEVVGHLEQAVANSPSYERAKEREELVSLPTGDGIALVFLRDPIAPVTCALEVARALQRTPGVKVRMGIHSGPVFLNKDINSEWNVTGPGINTAQRVMDCGDEGHILLSKTVADVLQQVRKWDLHISDLGEYAVKHGERIHICSLYTGTLGNAIAPRKSPQAQPLVGSLVTAEVPKYYIYISDTKVDMLFSQLSRDVRQYVANRLGADLAAVPACQSSIDVRVAKLEAVTEFLTSSSVTGTVDEPRDYITGSMAMKWGPYGCTERDLRLIYFAGTANNTLVAMGGSLKHVIGANVGVHVYPGSEMRSLFQAFAQDEELAREIGESWRFFSLEPMKESNTLCLHGAEYAAGEMTGPEQNVEFVAKQLLFGRSIDRRPNGKVLLASPIYVALGR